MYKTYFKTKISGNVYFLVYYIIITYKIYVYSILYFDPISQYYRIKLILDFDY